MRTVSSLVACACVIAVACAGSDDGGAAGPGDAGTGDAGTGLMAGTSGDGGTGSVPPPMRMMTMVPPAMMMMDNPVAGVGDENAPCMPGAMAACNAGLSCATLPMPFTGVCGRTCAMDPDCTMENEVCSPYLMADMQGICINIVPPWEIYAFPETSACNDTSTPVSISAMDQPYGLCLELCMLAGADPMDLPPDLPKEQIIACGMGQECLDIGLMSGGMAMAMPVLGACGIGVERGASCGDTGKVCTNPDDVCAPSDPMRLDSEALCFQNCTDMVTDGTCEQGTCTTFSVMGMVRGAYCIP